MLLSEAYRKTQAAMHERYEYGTASIAYAPTVAKLMNANRFAELLDYGAGRGNLMKAISAERMVSYPFDYRPYEPANPEWSAEPWPSDFVACIDVLEHVEPDCLDAVLDDLHRVTIGVGFFTVACGPARKVLPDGRNAHLIQQPPDWWLPKLMKRFDMRLFQAT